MKINVDKTLRIRMSRGSSVYPLPFAFCFLLLFGCGFFFHVPCPLYADRVHTSRTKASNNTSGEMRLDLNVRSSTAARCRS